MDYLKLQKTGSNETNQIKVPKDIGDLNQSTIEVINDFLRVRNLTPFHTSLLSKLSQDDFKNEVKEVQQMIYRGMINKAPELCSHCKHHQKGFYTLNLFSQNNICTQVLLLNSNFEPLEVCLIHHTPEPI